MIIVSSKKGNFVFEVKMQYSPPTSMSILVTYGGAVIAGIFPSSETITKALRDAPKKVRKIPMIADRTIVL